MQISLPRLYLQRKVRTWQPLFLSWRYDSCSDSLHDFSLARYSNKWSKKCDERPHRMGRIYHGDSWPPAVSLSPILIFLPHKATKHLLPMFFSEPDNSQNCLFPWGITTSSDTWFVGSTRVCPPIGILIGSVVFAGLTNMTNRHTHRSHYAVCSNRPHLVHWVLAMLSKK